MKTINQFFLYILIIAFVLSGCSGIINPEQPENIEDLVGTHVAQTQDANFQLETMVAGTLTALPPLEEKHPQASPTTSSPEDLPSATQAPTLVPTETAIPTAIPTEPFATALPSTSAVPLVQVSVPTNCRTGPGIIFDQVSVLNVGREIKVVGRDGFGYYWVVENPAGSGTCWLWTRYASVTGDTSNLPVWTSPPTPTPVAGVSPTVTGPVTVQARIPTNCRVGPGIPFEIVSVLRPGKSVSVVARHATADFWVIQNPQGSGTCWLWGEHAVFTGPKESLPIQEAPLPPTSNVTLRVSVPTNCRVGPGIPFEIVTVLNTRITANVVARSVNSDFWVIENPSGSGTCWVWDNYATLTGSPANLPVQAAPTLPTPAPSPTPGAVTLRVSVPTNCRIGPGKPFELVTVFRPGMVAEAVGRNAVSTFWVIRNPIGTGHCWVWGKHATLTGPSASLPIWNP